MMVSRKAIARFGLWLFITLTILYFIYSSYFVYVWHDESFALLHLSGRGVDELTAYLFDGQIKTTEELRQFQGVNPDRGLQDTIANLYTGLNYDFPLYYILLWILARLFGNSDLVYRGFSVIIWFGLLWAVYWLSWQLFKDRKTASIASFLVFISPRFTGYALGIWEYGLFVFIAALSSFLFLKAFDSSGEVKPWIVYSLSAIAGLYTHVFFVFVFLVHGLYFSINHKNFNSASKKYALGSFLVSFVLYSFWLVWIRLGRVNLFSWAKGRWSWEKLWDRSIATIAGFFPDLNFISPDLSNFTDYLFVLFIAGSFIYLVKNTERKIYSFVILLAVIPFLSLFILDILFGYRYVAVGRFYLPSFLGIALGIAFIIASGLQSYRAIAVIFLSLLTITGLIAKNPNPVSGVRFVGYGSNVPNAYSLIDRSPEPLIVAENWLDALPLIHVTEARTRYLFVNPSIEIPLPSLKNQFSHIYLLSPSAIVREKIERSGGKLEPTENSAFWKLAK